MTIQPRDVLSAFKPKFTKRLPPPRITEDDTLLVDIGQLCLKAQARKHLRKHLVALLGDIINECKLEEIAREHPGMIGTMCSETA